LNQLANLIYRVVNLAALSLIVVGTWACFTELTFLYIVYVLAFTGAVVMLFLSVVLMLPASVTSGGRVGYILLAVNV
jgi:NADH:ubiquinone oxidoreductase subunit 6 (subunit J)